MGPLCNLALTANLVLQGGGPGAGDAILTAPQRDALRARTDPASASVSADGRFVAFVSYAGLVTAGASARGSIYVLDRCSGQVTLESVDAEGRQLPGSSGHPRLSGDGRYLAFDVALQEADGTPVMRVLLRDRAARTTRWIDRNAGGVFGNGGSRAPAISADGGVVVFTSAATNLVPGTDKNGTGLDVYMYTAATGSLTRVSLDWEGRQRSSGQSHTPSLDATGRYLAFVSTAELSKVDAHPPGTFRHTAKAVGQVYLRDLATGLTTLVTRSARGGPANAGSWSPTLSGDGRHVVFASAASNLVAGDRNGAPDVFVHDTGTGVTALVSRSARRGAADGASMNPAISADGRFVAFQSDASDLICARRCRGIDDDVNLLPDVFLFDRTTRGMRRVSGGTGAAAWFEESGGPALSADGTVITFTSRRPIDPADLANDFDLFVLGLAPNVQVSNSVR